MGWARVEGGGIALKKKPQQKLRLCLQHYLGNIIQTISDEAIHAVSAKHVQHESP